MATVLPAGTSHAWSVSVFKTAKGQKAFCNHSASDYVTSLGHISQYIHGSLYHHHLQHKLPPLPLGQTPDTYSAQCCRHGTIQAQAQRAKRRPPHPNPESSLFFARSRTLFLVLTAAAADLDRCKSMSTVSFFVFVSHVLVGIQQGAD